MNLTESQTELVLHILNRLFTETDFNAAEFIKTVATDDLEEMWILRNAINDCMNQPNSHAIKEEFEHLENENTCSDEGGFFRPYGANETK